VVFDKDFPGFFGAVLGYQPTGAFRESPVELSICMSSDIVFLLAYHIKINVIPEGRSCKSDGILQAQSTSISDNS
jgi:hypothetical protein